MYINSYSLVAIKEMSLTLVVLANISVFLSMAQRLHFKVAQTTTFVGCYISFILLPAIIILTKTSLQVGVVYSYGQPFIYAYLSAAFYFVFATLLLLTTLGDLKGYHGPDLSDTLSLPHRDKDMVADSYSSRVNAEINKNG